MIDLSIITVNWNAKEHLLNCLKSIAECVTTDYTQEVIVVDNASSDGSCDAVESLFPEVALIKNNENLGFAKANNIGIRESRGQYVCLINSDVVVLEGCIKNLIDFMDHHPKAGIVGPKILNSDRSLQVQCQHFPTIWNHFCQALGLNYLFPKSAFFSEPFMKYWTHDKVRKVDVISGCFWMVRREALEKVGLLDEDFFIYGEDIDWCKRFNNADWDIMFYPGAEAIHFGAASAANAPTRFYIEMQKSDLHYWEKYHGRIGRAGYLAIILIRQTLRVVFGAIRYITRPSARESTCFKLKRSLACVRWVLHI